MYPLTFTFLRCAKRNGFYIWLREKKNGNTRLHWAVLLMKNVLCTSGIVYSFKKWEAWSNKETGELFFALEYIEAIILLFLSILLSPITTRRCSARLVATLIRLASVKKPTSPCLFLLVLETTTTLRSLPCRESTVERETLSTWRSDVARTLPGLWRKYSRYRTWETWRTPHASLWDWGQYEIVWGGFCGPLLLPAC